MTQAIENKEHKTYIYKKEQPVNKQTAQTTADKENAYAKYEPVIPQAPLDTKFHYIKEDGTYGIKAKLKMIESIEELKEFAKRCVGKVVGLDTETTGLSFGIDKIVGFSMALSDMEGYYVPIRHKVRHTTVTKKTKTDENGNIMYTKTGKPRTCSVKEYTYEDSPYNLPVKEALDILYDIMLNAKLSLWHNSDFDLNMLKCEGYDVMKCKTFDTMILPYIFDAEGKGISGLKPLEKRLLGRYRSGFKETVGTDENFQYTDPTKSQEYASVDATSCIAIYKKLYPMVVDLLKKAPSIINLDGKTYNIIKEDNNLIRAFVDYYDHAELLIDREEAKSYEKLVREQLATVTEEIFSYFGRGPFNLSTQSKEFLQVMEEAHINTGCITEKGNKSFGKQGIKEFNKNLSYLKNTVFRNVGYLRTEIDLRGNFKLPKKDQGSSALNVIANTLVKILKEYGRDYCRVIDQVNNCVIKHADGSRVASRMEFFVIIRELYKGETKKLNVLNKIKDYSSCMKALNSYITKLTEVDSCRMHYRLQGTASGRLSSGNSSKTKGKENKYYINLNAQNLTKPKQVFYKGTETKEEGNVLGWKFEHVPEDYAHEHAEDEVIVEAGVPNTNIRKCIIAPEGKYIASLDFCVSPETTIELQGGKKVPITYLENNPQMIKTPRGYELAHNFHYTGKRQKCVLTLKSGKKITCSPDHKFLVTQEDGKELWKPLKDILPTDSIVEE